MVTPDIIEQPSESDLAWLLQAEQHILNLLQHNLDGASLFHYPADLAIVQDAIDFGTITPEDELGTQCLGVILGNVFDAMTEMKWSIVTNAYGRLLALHSARIGFTLYPIQMIAKRMQSGVSFNVPDLYHSLVRDLSLAPTNSDPE